MNDNDLDLDINNYNMRDLETFFQIQPNQKYSAADIEEKEAQIREIFISSGKLNKRFQKDLIDFLEIARDWLIHVKCPEPKQPTTLPPQYQIDKTLYNEVQIPRTDELVNTNERQVIHTQTSDFFKGSLNPLNHRISTTCLNIDTKFRKDKKAPSSNYILQMPTKINKVVSMTLSALELPITFYGITEEYGNDYLYIKIIYKDFTNNIDVIEREKVLFVKDGNYNAADLLELLNKQLEVVENDVLVDIDDPFSYIHLLLDITSSGSGSGKVIIEPNKKYSRHSNILDITLDFRVGRNKEHDNNPINTKLGQNLGFLKTLYTGSLNYVADTIIDTNKTRYLYLAIDDYNNNVNNQFVSVFEDSILNANILARISLKGSFFAVLLENDFNIVTEPRRYFGPVDIQRLHIRLLDEYGRNININNADYSFCLNLKTVYDL
jgi:hypothetical protein